MTTQLVPIEVRVAELTAAGRGVGEIATELGISRQTADWHLEKAYRKLDLHSCDELADALEVLRAGTVERSVDRGESEATQ
jgi:DNA-binding CsgD family transcriptional regulator